MCARLSRVIGLLRIVTHSELFVWHREQRWMVVGHSRRSRYVTIARRLGGVLNAQPSVSLRFSHPRALNFVGWVVGLLWSLRLVAVLALPPARHLDYLDTSVSTPTPPSLSLTPSGMSGGSVRRDDARLTGSVSSPSPSELSALCAVPRPTWMYLLDCSCRRRARQFPSFMSPPSSSVGAVRLGWQGEERGWTGLDNTRLKTGTVFAVLDRVNWSLSIYIYSEPPI